MSKRNPEQTIAYRVYLNGSTDLLGIAKVDTPSFENMTETISGTGVAGEYDSPTLAQFQSMTVKLSWNSLSDRFTELLNPSVPLQLECKASVQHADQTTGVKVPVSYELTVFGHTKSATTGVLETAKKHGNETEIEVLRLQLELDGKEKIMLDKVNFIYRVDGVDLLLPIRAQIGLAY